MGLRKKINKDFFKKWNEDMAYVLGFVFADGGIVSNSRGGNYLALHSSDHDLLEHFKTIMQSEHKVSKRNIRSGNVYRIQIGSKEMVNDLKLLGMTESKTKRIRIPKIPVKNLPAFILGFFDGDGNVWVGNNNKKYITLQVSFTSASIEFLNDLKSALIKNYKITGGSLFKIKNKDCGRLTFSVKDSLKLYEIMYNKARISFWLDRKKVVFERYMKSVMRP